MSVHEQVGLDLGRVLVDLVAEVDLRVDRALLLLQRSQLILDASHLLNLLLHLVVAAFLRLQAQATELTESLVVGEVNSVPLETLQVLFYADLDGVRTGPCLLRDLQLELGLVTLLLGITLHLIEEVKRDFLNSLA